LTIANEQLEYPSLQEILDDCKRAVELSETDMKGFLRTGCASHVTGIYWGLYLGMPKLISEPKGECATVVKDLAKQFSQTICFPKDVWSKTLRNEPIELHIAKDIIAWVESYKTYQQQSSSETPSSFKLDVPIDFNTHESQALTGLIEVIYRCDLIKGE
jgi:hypothetical protein